MQQQYPSESQSEVELTVQDRQDSNSKQDVFDDDKTDRKTKIPGVAWLFCGLVAVAFVVAFALIGVALNDDDNNKEPSILFSVDANPPKNYVFGGGLHAGRGEWVGKRNMSVHRSDLSAVLSPYDGKIYVLGGLDSNETVRSTVEVFDPVFEIYEDTEVPDMPTPRHRFAAAATGENIYVIGGWYEQDVLIPVNTVDVFNIRTKTWSNGPNITYNRGDMTASVIDGKVYVIGGFGDYYDLSTTGTLVEMFDPDTQTWTTKSSMPTPRGDVASAVHKSCLFVVGGWNYNGGYSSSVERFCPLETPAWTQFPDLPFPRGDKSVSVFNGQLMAVGGETGGEVPTVASNRSVQRIPLHDVEALLLNAEEATGLNHMAGYDNRAGMNGKWIPAAPHPGPRFRFASATHRGPQGEQLFTFGGHAERTRTTGETWAFLDTKHPVAYVHYRK